MDTFGAVFNNRYLFDNDSYRGEWEAGIWARANQYIAQVKAGEAPMLTPEQAVERIPAFEFTGV